MKIGIVGVGIVGQALKSGFEQRGFEIKVHDIKFDTSIENVLDTDLTYICVPTPEAPDGSCNTSIVEGTIEELYSLDYEGCIGIKSTCKPGTTQRLIDHFDDRVMFVPEFLKERTAAYDFVYRHNLLVIGATNLIHANTVRRSHNGIANKSIRISPTEAEILKYMHNSFNAIRITFANILFEVCKSVGANYESVKEAFIEKNELPDEYLDVMEGLRGFAGICLPKDLKALDHFTREELELPYELWRNIINENSKFVPTAFPNMRLH